MCVQIILDAATMPEWLNAAYRMFDLQHRIPNPRDASLSPHLPAHLAVAGLRLADEVHDVEESPLRAKLYSHTDAAIAPDTSDSAGHSESSIPVDQCGTRSPRNPDIDLIGRHRASKTSPAPHQKPALPHPKSTIYQPDSM